MYYNCHLSLQTMNLSPSEETNHTDSLSTSYDTTSLNATTPSLGTSLPEDSAMPPVSLGLKTQQSSKGWTFNSPKTLP